MRSTRSVLLFCVVGAAWVAVEAVGETGALVPYPDGFRSWAHVKSMVLFEDHPLADPFEGIHHVYANPAALEGLETGQYVDGAVLVFDLMESARQDGLLAEGARKRIDVMYRDARRFPATGGWGFETFVGDSRSERLEQDVSVACYACHASRANRGYVFSEWSAGGPDAARY